MKETGYKQLVQHCAVVQPFERVLIVSDTTTREIGDRLQQEVLKVTAHVSHCVITPLSMHGQEPPDDVASSMVSSDVIFGLTHMSMAHTKARFLATQRGARYLSLPDYSFSVLEHPALLIDFHSLTPAAKLLADILSQGNQLVLTSDQGTHLTCIIQGRIANAAPGWCDGPGTLASPPDAEVNIAPMEDESEGTVIVDGSIPYSGLGKLAQSLKFVFKKGRVSSIEGNQKHKELLDALLKDNRAKQVLAEFGIGLNPQAHLCGVMLIDEGALGTVHIGIGSNSTIGGKNNVNFHLDLVIKNPTLSVDSRIIMNHGKLLCEAKLID